MRKLVLVAALVIVGCDQQVAQKPHFDGYAGLKFGISFNDALAATRTDLFNPYSIKGCLIELPIRGCMLHPESNLATYLSRDGVPYALGLAFNKHDKLTDISLEFGRETIEDAAQTMRKEDCIAIHDRTIDWLASEFGRFDNKRWKDDVTLTKTAVGNPYQVSTSPPADTFFASASQTLDDKRGITVMSHWMKFDDGSTNCSVGVQFRKPDSIERWTASPDLERDLTMLSSDGGE